MPQVVITASRVVHYRQTVRVSWDLWARLKANDDKAYEEAISLLDPNDVHEVDEIDPLDVQVVRAKPTLVSPIEVTNERPV